MKNFIKKIYQKVPYKKNIFTLLKKVYQPTETIYRHLYFNGKILIKVDKNHSFHMQHYGYQVENELFWVGLNGWEKNSLELWTKLCKQSNVIFDIGANTGVYSLLAKTINPNASVYAFEPVERVFQKLIKNAQLNNYDIICSQKAVSNQDGKAIIYDTDGSHTYSVTVNKDIKWSDKPTKPVEIEIITLKTFIEKNHIHQIDLMKIDVETHEPEVLEGFANYLKLYTPTLLIEILNEEIAKGVEKYLIGLNYLYFNIDETKGIKKVDKLEKSDSFNFLICSEDIAKSLELV